MARKVAYWITTVLASVMLMFSVIYLTGSQQVVEGFRHVGYPQQLRIVLGVAKPLAAIVLLMPGLPLLKEWAYAGIAFAWVMAFIAHWQAGDGSEAFAPLALLVLLAISYLTRPASRRLVTATATATV